MIPVTTYRDQPIAVFGLGASGMAASLALRDGGANLMVWDDSAERCDAALKLGLAPNDLYAAPADYSALVVAPGVPLTHPQPHELVAKATAGNVPVIGDIELFAQMRARLPGHQVVAITGTNGKSTTTALIAHIINVCGGEALACGNIGTPILALEALSEGGVYVIEMSSYQIDLTHSLQPELAILLNVAPDHLDRHGDIDHYAAVKQSLLTGQRDDGVAIVGVDDPWGRAAVKQLRQGGRLNVVPVSVERSLDDGVSVVDGLVFDGRSGVGDPVLDLRDIVTLPGSHNWQNAAAAYVTASCLGIATSSIQQAMNSFGGLAHRSEFVIESAGLRFINDSKATNVDAAIRALSAFDNIYWIAGGRSKQESLDPVASLLGNIAGTYLFGEAQQEMSDGLSGLGLGSQQCGTLEAAFALAVQDASATGDGTILLSPACASFDQFANFEIRGDAFKDLVADFVAVKGGRA
jgi:UDP-N-acetylmuramoylalanine--D-glutamate ligase